MSKESLDVPQADSSDAAHLVASTIIGLIPFVGGADLFKFIISPSLEKRKERWMQLVADAIRELQAQPGFSIEQLRDNEEFTTLLMQTTQSAYKTHLEEKHLLLKEGLRNAYSLDATFDIKYIYLNLLDKFNPVHLAILLVVEEHKEASQKCNSGGAFYDRLVELQVPTALATNGVLFLAVLEDLHQAGLIVVSSEFIITDGDVKQSGGYLLVGGKPADMQKINLTDLGRHFLQF
ncbi:MAG: hypothetical protein EOO60_04660, partial [Hymenobacter sp.]